jgi:acetoin utilization deacetylase AcuC-like enzyme
LCALSAAQAVLDGDARSLRAEPSAGPPRRVPTSSAATASSTTRRSRPTHLRNHGMRTKVAVLDIDYHHGNGTQAIFYDRSDVFFASIHGDPHTEYPFFLGHADETGSGAGLGANLNLPLPRGTGYTAWAQALEVALTAIGRFGADALVVSLGMDTFVGDPISGFTLTSDDYLRVGHRLRRAGLPTVLVFEGGYAVQEVGVNAANVLEGFLAR